MYKLRRSPRLLAAIALTAIFAFALGVGVLMPPAAAALPAHGTHVDYYSSYTYCVQVGYEFYDCNGQLQPEFSWGETSAYSIPLTYGCEAN